MQNCEEVAKAICSLLGVDKIEDFVARYEQGEDTNYALYCRVDELMKETEEYRAKVAEVGTRVRRRVKSLTALAESWCRCCLFLLAGS